MYSTQALIIGIIFQAVVGVWLPVILNFIIVYGLDSPLGYCFISILSWVALISMIMNGCEALFAYSIVLILIILSPTPYSEISRWSIFFAVCGGATPAFASKYLAADKAIDYDTWSLKSQEQAFFRLLSLLCRSGSIWPVLVLACEGASALVLIGTFFGFKESLSSFMGEQYGRRFVEDLPIFTVVSLVHSGFVILGIWLTSKEYEEFKERDWKNRGETGAIPKDAYFREVDLSGPLLFIISGLLFDSGIYLVNAYFPPYRNSCLNSAGFVFASRFIVIFTLFAKCFQWKSMRAQAKADHIAYIAEVEANRDRITLSA